MTKHILIFVAAMTALFAVAFAGQRDLAGRSTAPPDWPLSVVGTPDSASDVHFAFSPRSPLQGMLRLGRNIGLCDVATKQKPNEWLVAFNMEGRPAMVLERLARPLENLEFRRIEKSAGDWKTEQVYLSPQGNLKVILQYADKPDASFGPAKQAQKYVIRVIRIGERAG